MEKPSVGGDTAGEVALVANQAAAVRFYGWKSLSASSLVIFVVAGGVLFSFGAFIPSICREFGWSRGVVSGAATALTVVMSLSAPLAGMFIAKYGPRKALYLGNILTVMGLLLLAFHNKPWQLYLAYGGLLGIGTGLGGTLAATTVATNWFRKKVAVALGGIVASGGCGGIILIPALMAIITNLGWRVAYQALACLALVLAVVVPFMFVRDTPEELGQVPDGNVVAEVEEPRALLRTQQYLTSVDFSVQEAVKTRAFWLVVTAATMSMFIMSVIFTHQVAFLEGIGIGAGTAAATLGVMAGTGTLGNVVIGALALRFDMKHLAVVAAGVLLLSMVMLRFTVTAPVAFVYSIVFGLGNGATMVGWMTLTSSYFGRREYPKIMGLMMIVSALGNFGAFIAGTIYDATGSYHIAFLLALCAAAVGLVCLLCVAAPVHRMEINLK
ncbi:MAG: MFS transporter [Desulfuromonadaceae bacterium]|nr:MFS transporter [Desulfuromonadaceae bacterium]